MWGKKSSTLKNKEMNDGTNHQFRNMWSKTHYWTMIKSPVWWSELWNTRQNFTWKNFITLKSEELSDQKYLSHLGVLKWVKKLSLLRVMKMCDEKSLLIKHWGKPYSNEINVSTLKLLNKWWNNSISSKKVLKYVLKNSSCSKMMECVMKIK